MILPRIYQVQWHRTTGKNASVLIDVYTLVCNEHNASTAGEILITFAKVTANKLHTSHLVAHLHANRVKLKQLSDNKQLLHITFRAQCDVVALIV